VLSGPGIRGERQVVVDGLAVEVVEALIAANSAFPAGVDTFFVAADGSVIGLPRTTRVRIEGDR
jgi:alpha-D-ribose 1-methylphosphonate 5-triphosphate synthase subunit PhnH